MMKRNKRKITDVDWNWFIIIQKKINSQADNVANCIYNSNSIIAIISL
jgi:hypothetical protein